MVPNNILNCTYDGSHYFPSSEEITAHLMTENLIKGWDNFTTEVDTAIADISRCQSETPSQPASILSVVVGTRAGQTKCSTIAAGKISSLCFSVDNSSASRADFSQQSFSHLECNVPPFVGIIHKHSVQGKNALNTMSNSKRSRPNINKAPSSTSTAVNNQPPFVGIIDAYQAPLSSRLELSQNK